MKVIARSAATRQSTVIIIPNTGLLRFARNDNYQAVFRFSTIFANKMLNKYNRISGAATSV